MMSSWEKKMWKVLITYMNLITTSSDFLMLWVSKNSSIYFGDSMLH